MFFAIDFLSVFVAPDWSVFAAKVRFSASPLFPALPSKYVLLLLLLIAYIGKCDCVL